MTPARLTLLFRVDAVANLALGLASLGLLFAPDVLGVPRVVLALAGVVLFGNAADLARTGRAPVPPRAAVHRSVATDVSFGVLLVAVAAVGLDGQGDAARWILAAVGDVSLLVGVTKLAGVRRLQRAPA